ncbi:MAG: hypothetical protein LBF58_00975 [Deltaproteobacteria bacterium]|jgi:hypothetical protein|nr:hypothetical protein [Deltaproteobacteria bacterium]
MDNFYRELVKNPPLLKAVVAFNLPNHVPDRVKIHPAQGYGGADGQAMGLTDETGDREARLQALVESGVRKNQTLRRFFPSLAGGEDFWDFGPEPLRLTLLNEGDFDNLATRFGAAVWGEVLAQAVDAKTVRALKANLGEGLLDWAIDRGRFWLGNLGDIYRQGMEAPKDLEGIRLTGLRAINVAWDPLPPPLANRVKERVVDGGFPAPADNLAARTFARLKNLLLTEVAPSWRPCFS